MNLSPKKIFLNSWAFKEFENKIDKINIDK